MLRVNSHQLLYKQVIKTNTAGKMPITTAKAATLFGLTTATIFLIACGGEMCNSATVAVAVVAALSVALT